MADTVRQKSKEYWDCPVHDPFAPRKDSINGIHDSAPLVKDDHPSYGATSKARDQSLSSSKKPDKETRKDFADSGSYSGHPDQTNVLLPRNLEKTVNMDEKASHAFETNDDAASDPLPSEVICNLFLCFSVPVIRRLGTFLRGSRLLA